MPVLEEIGTDWRVRKEKEVPSGLRRDYSIDPTIPIPHLWPPGTVVVLRACVRACVYLQQKIGT